MFHSCSSTLSISAYLNADWAGYSDTRRSTFGYLVFLGCNLISLSSAKQPTVSRSSAKIEYQAFFQVCAETVWLRYLFHDLCFLLSSSSILLYCDNLSTTYMAACETREKLIESYSEKIRS